MEKSETRQCLEDIRYNLKLDLAAVTELFANYTYDDDRITDFDFIRMRGAVENAVQVVDEILRRRKKRT